MGYSNYINEMVTSSSLKDEDDDQLFYTKMYIDEELRVNMYLYVLSEKYIAITKFCLQSHFFFVKNICI